MKRLIFTMIAVCLAGISLSAQPNTKLRPDETVLLYGKELIGNTDPVVAKKVISAGYTMEESNGMTGPEEINEYGNIGNIKYRTEPNRSFVSLSAGYERQYLFFGFWYPVRWNVRNQPQS